jgi:hypothetical protein
MLDHCKEPLPVGVHSMMLLKSMLTSVKEIIGQRLVYGFVFFFYPMPSSLAGTGVTYLRSSVPSSEFNPKTFRSAQKVFRQVRRRRLALSLAVSLHATFIRRNLECSSAPRKPD